MNKAENVVWIVFCYICARVTAVYLRTPYEWITRILLFILFLYFGRIVRSALKIRQDSPASSAGVRSKNIAEPILTGLWAALFSLFVVMGYHLSIKKAYSGTSSQNVVLPYTAADAAAFLLIFAGCFLLSFGLYLFLSGPRKRILHPAQQKSDGKPISRVLLFLVLFLCYVPYLLVYWPGLVMGDTIISIDQAMGWTPLTIAHPILYTLFIRLCFTIGHLFESGNTIGCAVYCVLQMAYMAFGFSALIAWFCARVKHCRLWAVVLCLFFGVNPYMASYSVAMWKDPVFSVSLLLLTICIYDFLHTRDTDISIPKWLYFCTLTAITLASRSNGFYALLVAEAGLLLTAICLRISSGFAHIRKTVLTMTVLMALLLLFSRIIHGPVYSSFGITEKKEEAVGLFLNQMARATVLGSISEEDAAYMNEMLPLEMYPEVYTPCCIDHLKWHPQFDAQAMTHDFRKHWLSMFRSNPRLYLESWEFQTCGFWAVNVEPVNTYTRNIVSSTQPKNLAKGGEAELERCHIQAANLLRSDFWQNVFPLNDWFIPVSWITWLILLLAVYLLCAGLKQNFGAILSLIPSAGLLLSLLIGTPIWYWPRYGAAVQFLLPFYAILFAALGGKSAGKETPEMME